MSPPRIHLLLDFDGTIIEKDTLRFFDYLRQEDNPISYDSFFEPYMQDYTQHLKEYEPIENERTTLQQEYDFLESLLKVERKSIERIESSGWLRGLKWSSTDVSAFDNAVSQIGHKEKLSWRPGLINLVQWIWSAGGLVDIVSVNWSSNFIRALLKQQFGRTIDINKIGIYSNEFDPSGSGRFSRILWKHEGHFTNIWPANDILDNNADRGLWTTQDKAQVMQAVIKPSIAKNMVTVYVGDSKTDLRCIMEADIGICVRDGTDTSAEQISLKKVLGRLQIKQFPLEKLDLGHVNRLGIPGSQGSIVYYAPDLNVVGEALSLLTGSDQNPSQ